MPSTAIKALTRQNNVKDAWVSLPSDFVGGRAHESAVVLVVVRRVRELGPGGVDRDGAPVRDVDEVGRVVESPSELDVNGVGHHVAQYVYHLAFAHAEDDRIGVLAHGNV